MTTDKIKTSIRDFIGRTFANVQLEDNQDIFSLGFINSLFAMQLVLFLEQNFHMVVEDEDLEMDNFRTITNLVQLVERKNTQREPH